MSTRISAEDYTHLLGLELWNYIHRVNSLFPEDFSSLSIPDQRAAYNAMLNSLRGAYPETVAFQDQTLITQKHLIPTRCYEPIGQAPAAHLIYFHGGGFVLGDLDSHHGICADLCAGTGLRITAIDYRLAPEHVFPAALEDAVLAYQALAAQESLPLIVMGDSAGACLAAHVAAVMRDQTKAPLAQVLIYPVLGSDLSLDSYKRYALAPLLTTESMKAYWQTWLGTEPLPKQLAGIPLAMPSFAGLPKTIIFSAEFDPLVGEAEAYVEQLKAAGVPVTWQQESGLVHGYLHARHHVESARSSFARIVTTLKILVA